MIAKRLCLASVALLVYCSSSYSEIIQGTTGNAASAGYAWVMTQVLPQVTGLSVNAVRYTYTTVKDTESDMVVYVQNEDPINGGYVFREVDDWSGLPSNTIRKVVPVSNIPSRFWGDGSIEWEGEGEVTDPIVNYSYEYDTCFDPQSSPACPGYIFISPVELVAVDPLDEDYIQNELDRKATLRDEEEEEDDRKQMKKKEDKKKERNLEAILGVVQMSVLEAQGAAAAAELQAMSLIPQSYNVALPTTTYEETIVLPGGDLPKNKRGRRLEWAQQKLHEELVDLQYD